ncbi:bifunctional sugar phosphate isomerase/epimerase/4-hydroxyphenylpyruvate dioxygenase family protein [Maricaulis parjimensis]|uniref:bifunctional sugar phosphate isomerase/epimerase/4-hydroxyphenylpyruvate dioxygenase family protein n=1 Tax=Maricaulis parjimensis TaxID=144023 RepID=UPI00193AD9F8|nr:sugar phosphate isomerase/epimerase and 4-hydroxyphenylpyruvate domain-containing protein [Maricaulis parjimensis]
MRHSIATVSISGTLNEKLKAVAAAGFKGVEIFEHDLLAYPGSAADIGRMIRDEGLVCTAFQPFRDLEGMPGAMRRRVFDRLERKFDVMEDLGAQLLLVCSNVSEHSVGDRTVLAADLREAGERAGRRGLRIGYEALAWGRHVSDHRDAWQIVQAADHPNLGLILDTFHSLARNIPSDSLLEIDPAKIELVQIADAPLIDAGALYWSRHFRCMPGQGDFDLETYVANLQAIGFDGALSLEIFNDRFRAASTAQIALDGRRSLLALEDQIARHRGAASALAPPPVCHGVEFLEFAASESEAMALSDWLSALGFAQIGQHRRKAVTRWRQGGINIVVNSEAEGFAASHALVHGCSVCAIGLKVDAAGDALARARALGMTAFDQPVAEGEYEIPAVRAVGGSLLYFMDSAKVDDIWTDEFVTIGAAPRPGPLTRVDHVAHNVAFEEVLTWLLYYSALLGLEKSPLVEIPDPFGLVQSQAVQNADRSLRISMSGSAARQSLSSRMLTTYFGSGVQHIAFETDDILAAADRMRAAGASLLDIPDSYYDDIGARFGLDAALLDRLRAARILYDQDADGEYFQFYTRAFAKRFFFEVVERRGYDAFGAANAAIRLASQTRFRSDDLERV